MEKLDKTKVKVLEHASSEDASKTAASTEVIFSLLLYHCHIVHSCEVSRKIFIALFYFPSIFMICQHIPGSIPMRCTEKLGSLQALREILEQVRTFSKLEALLLRKKSLHNGDTLQRHIEKVRN